MSDKPKNETPKRCCDTCEWHKKINENGTDSNCQANAYADLVIEGPWDFFCQEWSPKWSLVERVCGTCRFFEEFDNNEPSNCECFVKPSDGVGVDALKRRLACKDWAAKFQAVES